VATSTLPQLRNSTRPPLTANFRTRTASRRALKSSAVAWSSLTSFVVASPEYNASFPGVLKNAIDWVSRFRPQPFNERHGLLISASPSMAGGNRGLWSLRIPLEHLGARLYPDMFSLAQAHKALGPDGRIVNDQLQERFEANVANFMDLVEASKHYPCMKRAWVEYLGEAPDPVLDRVES
jgi:chromate reductase